MCRHRRLRTVIQSVLAIVVFFTAVSAAQAPRAAQPAVAANAPQMTEKDLAAMQDELLKELRVSPTLAEVVAHDPSLLSNAEYVSRSNPELGHFLQAHPEIAQNPDFYLFNNLHGEHEQPSQTLERKLWPEMSGERHSDPPMMGMELVRNGVPFLVFLCILS